MGSSSFCLPVLKELSASKNDILRVYTQPPRPAGRGNKLLHVPVASYAKELGLDLRQPENFHTLTEVDILKELNPDLIIVLSYGLILPIEVLKIPRIAPLNIHASILPMWRGAAPIQRAIINGDSNTGLSLMKMEEGLDTGPIYEIVKEPIFCTDTYTSVSSRLSILASKFLLNFIEKEENFLSPRAQEKLGASYADKISKSETQISWSRPAFQIDNLVRGLADKPGAWTTINEERVKLLLSRVAKPESDKVANTPGQVLKILDLGIEVACGKGSIIINILQRPGKKALRFDELLKGFKIFPGQIWG